MKTKILFIALTIVCSSLGIASAQTEKRVYNFAYAYSYEKKMIYVSCMTRGVMDSKTYFDASDTEVKTQWREKLRTFLENSYDYTIEVWLFRDYDMVDDRRTKIIGDFKEKGFSVRYVDDFYYRQSKRE